MLNNNNIWIASELTDSKMHGDGVDIALNDNDPLGTSFHVMPWVNMHKYVILQIWIKVGKGKREVRPESTFDPKVQKHYFTL